MGDFDPRKLLERRFTLFARISPPDRNSQLFIQLLKDYADDVTVVDYDQVPVAAKRAYFPWLKGFPMLAEWNAKAFYAGQNAYNVILQFVKEQKEIKDGAFSADVDHVAKQGISIDEWALPFSTRPMEHVLGQTFDSGFSLETDEQRLARKIPIGKRGGFKDLLGEYQQQRARHDAMLAKRMGQPVSAPVSDADVKRQVEAIQRSAASVSADLDVPALLQQTPGGGGGGQRGAGPRGVPVNSEGARRGEALLQAQRDLVKGGAT